MTSCSSCSSKNENSGNSAAVQSQTNNVQSQTNNTSSQQTPTKSEVNTDEKQTCTTCKGTGKVHGKQCNVCLGFGYLRVLK